MWDLNYKNLHILFTLQVALFGVVWAVVIWDFFKLESVKTDIMNSSKRQTIPLTKSSISPQSLFDGVRLLLKNFPPIQWAIFVASRSRGPDLVFHWSAAWRSWQPLWRDEISFQDFTIRSLNLGLYFCMDFPSSSELIGYLDSTDSWSKCSLVINAQEHVRLFWYSKYFPFYALSIYEDLQNRFSRQPIGISEKPHTGL